MTIIGLDPHPTSHTAAALDQNGRSLALKTVENTSVGLESLRVWAEGFPERTWAIEGASNPFILEFVHASLERGERVVNIAPNLTSQYRSRHGTKKTDVIDAQNAARALKSQSELTRLRDQCSPRADQKLDAHPRSLAHAIAREPRCVQAPQA